MRSLFLRILLSFWVALALIGVAFAVIVLQSDSSWRRERWAFFLGHALRSHGAAVIERLERDGAAGAEEALRAFAERTGMRTFLFVDGEPGVTLGTPSAAVVAAARAAWEGGAPVHRLEDGMDRLAEPLGGDGGPSRYVVVGELPHPTRLERYLSLETVWLRLLAAVLVAGGVGWLLTLQITRPVRRLREATRRLEAGDLGARVGGTLGRRRDEIAALGRDFDRMAERIEALVETERRLLRDVSHELRSPLARIQVALQLARTRAGAGAQAPLDQIEKDAERLSELVGQVLAVTRLESDPGGLPPEPVDLAELVRAVCEDADFEARARGRRVEATTAAVPPVQGVEEVLRRAVENVVRNAVRFTAEGTAVEVGLEAVDRPEGRAVRIRVRDHGPGVPAEALVEIFRPFRRVDEARGRGEGGVGLGLAITDRAVRAHGGAARAANAPGGGLVVEIDLPASGHVGHR